MNLVQYTEQSPAPALERGILLLRYLNDHPGCILENIAQQQQWPKSSTLRLLTSLAQLGLSERSADGKWSALQRLMPIHDQGLSEQSLATALKELAAAHDMTAEWWIPGPQGMILSKREEPAAGAVYVRAKPGFVRVWNDELDAVACLGHAHFPELAPALIKPWHYASPAVRKHLSKSAMQRMLQQADRDKFYRDSSSNANGVMRHACLCQVRGKAIGILSLAAVAIPGRPSESQPILDALIKSCAQLDQPPL